MLCRSVFTSPGEVTHVPQAAFPTAQTPPGSARRWSGATQLSRITVASEASDRCWAASALVGELVSSLNVGERFPILPLLHLLQSMRESLCLGKKTRVIHASWRLNGVDQWGASDFLCMLRGTVKCSNKHCLPLASCQHLCAPGKCCPAQMQMKASGAWRTPGKITDRFISRMSWWTLSSMGQRHWGDVLECRDYPFLKGSFLKTSQRSIDLFVFPFSTGKQIIFYYIILRKRRGAERGK